MPTYRLRFDLSRGLWVPTPHAQVADSGFRALHNAVNVGTSLVIPTAPQSAFTISGAGPMDSLVFWNGALWISRGTAFRKEDNTLIYNSFTSGFVKNYLIAPPTVGKADALYVCNGAQMVKLVGAPTPQVQLWGISPPASLSGVGTTALSAKTKTISALDSASGWTATDCVVQTDSASYIQGTGSIRLESSSGGVIPKDTHAHVTNNITVNANQFTTSGDSADQDFIAFYVRTNRPRNVVSVSVTFSVGGTSFEDAYSKEFPVKVVNRRRRRRLIALGDLIPLRDQRTFLQNQGSQRNDLTFSASHGEQRLALAKKAWTRVTVPKAAFEALGRAGSTGYTWADVQAIRLEIETAKSGGTKCWFDYLHMTGGTGMLGDYQYTFTWANSTTGVRSNPPQDSNGKIVAVEIRNVERHGVRLTGLNAPALQTTDGQVDRLEIWRTIGNGDVFFYVGSVNMSGGVATSSTYDDNTADYVGMFDSASAVLDPTRELRTDNDCPRDITAFSVATPRLHHGRVFISGGAATAEKGRVYYSPIGRPDAVAGFLEVSHPTDPVTALAIWNGRLFALTPARVLEIVNEDEPFLVRAVDGAVGTAYPRTVVTTSFGIFWRADTGIAYFDGGSYRIVSEPALHGVFGNAAGAEGLTIDASLEQATWGRGELWVGTVTSGGNRYLVYNPASDQWRTAGAGEGAGSILYVPERGKLYVTNTGVIYELEQYPLATGLGNQTFDITTVPMLLNRGKTGILQRLYIEQGQGVTGSVTSQVRVIVDGTTSASLGPLFPGTAGRSIVEFAVSRAGQHFQIRIDGTDPGRNCRIYAIEADVYVPEGDLAS